MALRQSPHSPSGHSRDDMSRVFRPQTPRCPDRIGYLPGDLLGTDSSHVLHFRLITSVTHPGASWHQQTVRFPWSGDANLCKLSKPVRTVSQHYVSVSTLAGRPDIGSGDGSKRRANRVWPHGHGRRMNLGELARLTGERSYADCAYATPDGGQKSWRHSYHVVPAPVWPPWVDG